MDFELIIGLVATVMALGIPLYAIKRTSDANDSKRQLKHVKEQQELEKMRQENFLLENKHMELELEKIKNDRKLRDEIKLEREDRWLIEDKDRK
ncbi:hypothetical protein [Aliicoccus persicus]|uniref:Uncharacterized protein n=1 Tax=Aliicoccus persicus TaxID=930138 RepID=A0A662Z6K5_9STAP|nr:hypothetical protein [Aliicoccus persicus]SEV99946.1 hypothetical protein SAMN05192557_1142 [Aliicoccus persicus]